MEDSFLPPQTSNGQRRVNLRGIIQLDQMEEFLSHLLEKVTRQETAIAQLTALCSSLMSINEAHRHMSSTQEEINTINKKLDQITFASTAHMGSME